MSKNSKSSSTNTKSNTEAETNLADGGASLADAFMTSTSQITHTSKITDTLRATKPVFEDTAAEDLLEDLADAGAGDVSLSAQQLLEMTERIAKIGGWAFDVKSGVVLWSDQVYRLHEIPIGTTVDFDMAMSFFSGSSRRRLLAAVTQALEQAQPYDLELTFTTARGTPLWVRAIGLPSTKSDLPDAPVERLWGVVQDITAEKRHSIELAKQRAFLQSILDAMPSRLVITDRDGNYLLVNRAKAESVGTTAEAMIGSNSRDYYSDMHVQTWLEDNERIFSEKAAFTREFYRDGVTVSSLRFPVLDANGEVIAKGALGIDITQQKRVEEALLKAKEEAESANRVKSMFIANVSHELRTPLTAILGFAELLKDAPDIPEKRRSQLHTMYQSGRQLFTLINDVLELSKVESGSLAVNLQDLDLYALLTGLQEMFELQARSKGLNLQVDFSQAPQRTYCDPAKLRQVLVNLLGNAVKFTDTGRVSLLVSQIGDSLRYTISDSGSGIAAHELPYLFEPFMQLQAGKQKGGSGLGLAIVKSFVNAMQGSIDVRSREGYGTTFEVTLPYRLAKDHPDASESVGPTILGLETDEPHYRILAVDDVQATHTLLDAILRPLGFVVEHAYDGREAFERVLADPPDLVLMDILMPEMDGFEATRAIRKHLGDGVKIIALSASTFEEERDRIIRSGCDDMMHKPFVRSTLLETLQEHLHLNYRYLSAGTRQVSAASTAETPPEVQLPAELTAALLEHLEVGDIETATTLLEETPLDVLAASKAHVLELLYAFRIDETLRLLTQSQP